TMTRPVSTGNSLLLAFRTWRDDVIRAGSRLVRTLRYDPKLNRQICTTATIDGDDAPRFDTARVHQVVLRAIRTCLPFPNTGAIGNDVAFRTRIVLQLYRIVVEPCFLIIE